MKLLITGSRTLEPSAANLQRLLDAIDAAHVNFSILSGEYQFPTEIIHGGAKGGDELASLAAKKLKIKETIIRPDYENNHSKAAPLIRNREMVRISDMTIAFHDGKPKGGTQHTATETVKSGKPLLEIFQAETKITTPNPGLF